MGAVVSVVSGRVQGIVCPDCEETFLDRESFVAHREQAHPPSLIAVSGAGGIRSQEAHGFQPVPDDEE